MRNALLPAGTREENIPCDLNDTAWFDRIDASGGVVFFAAGVFYYFLKEQVRALVQRMAAAFPGDERQRISIARAFLKDAPIVLLDEATASLDVENETLIQTALSRLIRNKTVLVIAHRMRTVAGADKIVVLADGVVAEQGSPDELYAKNGLYTHMVELQNGSQSWSI